MDALGTMITASFLPNSPQFRHNRQTALILIIGTCQELLHRNFGIPARPGGDVL
jgi:hypothetical protein